ncbi:hypothetical protein [Larkinella punicea]|uniref:DUF3575 domain-containing protein n=1 Tax=Larkinella punicea TaxID=2315727 RepID=A0A368JIG6_9BACT|nr:hypothetical protein [Larkinella punicea]RCR67332.1 hypothetical protein DUE52_22660 [Larkinella punicea]
MNLIQKGLLAIMLISSSVAFGQITEDPEERRGEGKDPLKTKTPEGDPLPFSQRLRFGGGISNVSIGNPFSIGVAPVIAYQASERAILGVGINYVYYRAKLYYQGGATEIYRANQYGGRVFGMYEIVPNIVKNLYVHGEFENTNVGYTNYNIIPYETQRRWVSAGLVGLTYSQPISRRFGVNLTALYNLSYNADPTFSSFVYGGSPWVIRVSFF